MLTAVIVIAVIALILILMYNSLVAKKNQVANIFANIDVQLKKRFDLIPNLIASVQEYMEHEKSLLEEVTKLRADAIKPNLSEKDMINLDAKLSSSLGSIMVAVENYPELKANENMMQLQKTLHEIESQISATRRAYNQVVTDYNNALEMIPTNFMAQAMNYKPRELFIIPDTQRENVDVKELFDR